MIVPVTASAVKESASPMPPPAAPAPPAALPVAVAAFPETALAGSTLPSTENSVPTPPPSAVAIPFPLVPAVAVLPRMLVSVTEVSDVGDWKVASEEMPPPMACASPAPPVAALTELSLMELPATVRMPPQAREGAPWIVEGVPEPSVIVSPLMVAVTDGPTVTTVPRRFPSRMVLPAPAPVRVRLLLTTTRFRVFAAVYVPAAMPIVSPLAASPIATSMLAQGCALAAPHGAAAAPPGATYQVAAA